MHFSAHTLPEVVRDLYLNERDGVLTLVRDGASKRLHFSRGLIISADSTAGEDDLGQRLVRDGLIGAGALEEARSQAAEPGIPLGGVLVRRELLSAATLQRELRSHVERILVSVFGWEAGHAEFGDGQPAGTALDADVLGTCQMILAGIGGMAQFQPVHEAMLALDRPLRVRTPAPVPVERLALGPLHGFVLSRVDGTTTLRDVISIVPPEEEAQASRFLYGLLLLGVIEFDPPVAEGPFRVASILRDHGNRQALEALQARTIEEAIEATEGQDPFRILGLERGAPRQAIDRAYEEMKNTFGRERLLPRVRDRFRTELAVIESRLIEAYLKVSRPLGDRPAAAPAQAEPQAAVASTEVVRVELDKAQSRLERERAERVAENYFAQARKALREGDYHNAIQYGKLAVSYNDTEARYYFLIADCQARNPDPRWQHLAEQNYAKAADLDPWNAEYPIALGRLYKRRGLKLRAKKYFEDALRMSPQHELALREMHDLE